MQTIMTVKELIEELKKYPPETRVVVDGYEGGYDDVASLKNASLVLDAYVVDWYGPHAEESSYQEWVSRDKDDSEWNMGRETVKSKIEETGGVVDAVILSSRHTRNY